VDEAEDEQYGEDRRGDELPEELQRREERLKKIQEAKQRLEDRQKQEDRAAGRSENDGGWASGVRPQAGVRGIIGSLERCRRKDGELHGSAEPDHEDTGMDFSSATTDRSRWRRSRD